MMEIRRHNAVGGMFLIHFRGGMVALTIECLFVLNVLNQQSVTIISL